MAIDQKKLGSKFQEIKAVASTSLKMIKFVWGVDKWLFLATLIAMIIPAVVPFINLYIYKLVIDLVVASIAGAPFVLNKFLPLIALRIFTYYIQNAAFATQALVERLLWTKVPIYLNEVVFSKITSLDAYYFENDKFKDMLEKVRDNLNYRPQNLVDNILYALQSLVQFSIAFITLARLNWFLIILIALVAIPSFIEQSYRAKISWGLWGGQTPDRKRFWYLSNLMQSHQSIKEIKIFKLAKQFVNQITGIQGRFYNENKSLAVKSYVIGLLLDGVSTAVFIGIEIFVILEAFAKRVTVGDINFYTGVVSNYQNSLGGLLRNVNGIYEHGLYVSTIFEVLDLKPIIKIPENGVKLDLTKPPLIEFKNVDFSYPDSTHKVLNNFLLTIKPGEKIAFVGENGAGKSTIIRLLARFYDVDAGEILINGVNIKDLDLTDWYKNIGVLFQDFNRYEDPVKTNIHYGNIDRTLDLKQIISAATSSGAHKMINQLDDKYNQMLGKTFEKGTELSGGQWQKIALSRAFFRNAPVLVLDEPTSAIDAKAESEIFGRVEKLSKEKTVIIISHRFSTVRNADKIFVIDKGRIVEQGSHEQLMKLDGQYSTLFKLQAKGYQ